MLFRRDSEVLRAAAYPSHHQSVLPCAIPHYPGYYFRRLGEWFHSTPPLKRFRPDDCVSRVVQGHFSILPV